MPRERPCLHYEFLVALRLSLGRVRLPFSAVRNAISPSWSQRGENDVSGSIAPGRVNGAACHAAPVGYERKKEPRNEQYLLRALEDGCAGLTSLSEYALPHLLIAHT